MIHNLKRSELLKIPNRFPLIFNLIKLLLTIILKLSRFFTPSRNVGRDVILSFHRIGDTVFTIPALRGLFAKRDLGNFRLFCFPESASIYKYAFPNLNIISVRLSDFNFEGRIANRKIRKLFSSQTPKNVIDFTGTTSSISIFLGIRVNKVFGLSDALLTSAYDLSVSKNNVKHLTDLYINCVKLIDGFENHEFEKSVKPNFLKDGVILIQPFAGWRAKEWGLDNYISLADSLSKNYQIAFVFPDESNDENLIQKLQTKKIGYILSRDLSHFISICENVSLLISNDSGPIHVASLLGKPTFTIYGPTNPSYHVPLGEIHRFISKNVHCSPTDEKYCYTKGGEFCTTYECMVSLKVQEVLNSINDFLRELDITPITKINGYST